MGGIRTSNTQHPRELNCLFFSPERFLVYPSLDDDGDGPLFKSRSKNPKKLPKDAPWNPKAKVCSLTPRARVPSRDNAKRPNIETGLADAAARLATKVCF